jgi:AcrR family transcriptional regulator
MSQTRTYRQSARAEATAATKTAIVEATIAAARELLTLEITLDQIAERAGVSVQTVLRHFGSKDALFAHALGAASVQIADDRRVEPGDIDAAVRAVVDHYEVWGELVVRLVAAETSDDRIRRFTSVGKGVHRRWVEESFAPQLTHVRDRDALVDVLSVATDLQVWSLLRRDRGLAPGVVRQRMRLLIDGALSAAASPERTRT